MLVVYGGVPKLLSINFDNTMPLAFWQHSIADSISSRQV